MRNTTGIFSENSYTRGVKDKTTIIFNFIDDTFPFCQFQCLFNLPNYVNQQLENLPQYCNFICKALCVFCIVLICIGFLEWADPHYCSVMTPNPYTHPTRLFLYFNNSLRTLCLRRRRSYGIFARTRLSCFQEMMDFMKAFRELGFMLWQFPLVGLQSSVT